MQSTKVIKKISTSQIQGKLAELNVPLLSQEHLNEIKSSPHEEVKECITILRKSRRKACCIVWTARLSIIFTAATTIFVTVKNYFQAEAAEESSQQLIKNQLINQFRDSGCTRCGWDGCDEYTCTGRYPNALPMMLANSKSDCCYDNTFRYYHPCTRGFTMTNLKLFDCYQSCVVPVSKYCSLTPVVVASEYLIALIAASAGGGILIIKELYNIIREQLGNDLLIFFFPMSRLERCFVFSSDMQKIKEISTKYKIVIDEKNVRKMLLAFETFSAEHHSFFKSKINDKNKAQQIEFSDNVSKLKEATGESVAIRLAS